MKGRLALLCLAAGALAGCGGSGSKQAATTTDRRPSLPLLSFAYAKSAPLNYKDIGVTLRRGPITVHDVAFLSGDQGIDGYLVEDSSKKRHAAVVLVHGSGGDRSQLLGDAFQLAKRGIVALTITAPSTADPPPPPTSNKQLIDQSKQVTVADVVAVRRAADVLASLPNVDPGRIGYLGWSAGAKTGAFVAAADPRFKALALLSAGADKLSAFVKTAPVSLRPLVKKDLGLVDPLRYVAAARPGTLLLEDGRRDEVIPRRALLNVIQAAPAGTVVHWYPSGHSLTEKAYLTAFAWLAHKLS
jgi:dienelactone hydrolase